MISVLQPFHLLVIALSGWLNRQQLAVTADTVLRLARYFGISEEFWMGLQADYDLEEARCKLGNRLIDEVSSHAV
jgi:addiction module HigA family antidote